MYSMERLKHVTSNIQDTCMDDSMEGRYMKYVLFLSHISSSTLSESADQSSKFVAPQLEMSRLVVGDREVCSFI